MSHETARACRDGIVRVLLVLFAQARTVLRTPHTWVILALLSISGIIHYAEQIGIIGAVAPDFHFGLAHYAFNRILFLVPILYSGFIFGLAGGLATAFIALCLMLPHVLLVSPSSADALLDTAGIILVGVLASLLFRARTRRVRAEEQGKQALEMMDIVQEKLRSQVRRAMKHQERLSSLSSLSTLLAKPLEPEHTLRIAIDRIINIMGVDIGLVFLLNRRSNELVLTAYEGISPQLAQNVGNIRFDDVFNGQAAETVEEVRTTSTHVLGQLRKLTSDEEIQAQLSVPIRTRGLIIGFFWIATRRKQEFSRDDIDLLTAIGNEIGIALENVQLYQAQLETTKQLETSERKFKDLFEKAHDAIWVHDMDGNITSANDASAKLTGYKLDELHRMNVKSFLSKESLRLAKKIRTKLLNEELVTQPYEQKLIAKQGAESTLRLSTNVIKVDGKPVGFQNIARDVTDQRRMEENLNFYLQHITQAQEEERKRMSRELHDSTAQNLIAMIRQLGDFLQDKAGLNMDDIRLLWGLHEELRSVLQEVRQFARDLRPSILDDLGLLPSLEWLCSEMEKVSRIDIKLQVAGSVRRSSAEVELMIFRIIQEALRNVVRHSSASQALVTVAFNERFTKMTIEDNGEGFVLPKNIIDLSRLGKLGLAGMQERVRLLSGKLRVESKLDKGTKVVVEVPL